MSELTFNEKKFYAMFKESERRIERDQEKMDRLINNERVALASERIALEALAATSYELFERAYLKINKDRYVEQEMRFIETEALDENGYEKKYDVYHIKKTKLELDSKGRKVSRRRLPAKFGKKGELITDEKILTKEQYY